MKLTTLLFAPLLLGSCAEPSSSHVDSEERRAVTEAILSHVLPDPSERPLFRRSTDATRYYWSDNQFSWQSRPELLRGTAASFLAANAAGSLHEEWLGALGVGLINEADYQAHFNNVRPDGPRGWETRCGYGWG